MPVRLLISIMPLKLAFASTRLLDSRDTRARSSFTLSAISIKRLAAIISRPTLTAAASLLIVVFSLLIELSARFAPRSMLSKVSSARRPAISSLSVFASIVYSIVPTFLVMVSPLIQFPLHLGDLPQMHPLLSHRKIVTIGQRIER